MALRGFAPKAAQTADPSGGEPTLDASQQRVLELPIDRSAVVVGAPGSGKTTTLVQFAVDRVHRLGIAPSSLLVLAPTRLAANRLRDRLALRVDRPTNGPLARTVTSVAFSIIQAEATRRSEPLPRLLTGAEQDSIITELLQAASDDRRPTPEWPPGIDAEVRGLPSFRTELRELMMRVTEAGLRPADLRVAGRRYERPEWLAVADFMTDYERVVDGFGTPYLDSAEVISEATHLITTGAPLADLQLLLVDDVQEHGAATLEMMRALAQRGVTVTGFGDPDVAAATFRGSDPLALAEFGSRLGVVADTLVLDTVHRHGEEVRGFVSEISQRIGASGVVAHRRAGASTSTALQAGAPVAGESSAAAEGETGAAGAGAGAGTSGIRHISENTAARLDRRIGRILREQHLLHGVPWSKMAVIVRSGSLIAPIERALALADVPTSGSVGTRTVQAHHAAGHLLTAAAVAVGAEELTEASAVELLTGPLSGLDRMALRRLRLALRHQELAGGGTKQGTQLLFEALQSGAGFAAVDSTPARRAHRFSTTLAEATRLAREGGSIEEVLWHLWDRSGLAGPWSAAALGHGIAADEANRQLDGVMALFTAAKRFVERAPGAPASNFVVEARHAAIREDSLTPTSANDAVWLGTPNTLVGAEVEVVVLAGLQDGVWPNPRVRGTLLYPQEFTQRVAGLPVDELDARSAVLSDELRLFELAVSRAKKLVVLAAVDSEDEHPSLFMRFSQVPPAEAADAEHPLTLRGLVGHLRRVAASPGGADAADTADAAVALARLARAGVPGADPAEWYGLAEPTTRAPLTDLDEEDARVRVSPSQMETFEKTPLAWFIDKMAAMPSGIAANVGTIVHAALENSAEASEPSEVSPEALWVHVDDRWSELHFEASWIGERQRRSVDTLVRGLSEYLTDFLRSGAGLVSAEGAFEVTIDQVTLSGKIDRVERTREGEIVIVDLKTGRFAPSQPSVDQNAQLGGYQLAGRRGAIPGVEGTDVSAGGALLYVSHGVRGKSYRLLTQKPLSDDELGAFEERVRDAGHGMAASTFPGVANLDERDPKAGFVYRIHLVGAVSS